jgi:pyrrolysine biosynthesis protein PylC
VRVAVVGGNLQGVEAAYLAKKAGWEVTVIDRRPFVPASGLCDKFIQLNISAQTALERSLKDIDLIIPALENSDALACLNRWSQKSETPFAFDPAAYCISSSKVKSDKLFARIGVPTPLPWPECDFPVFAKPSLGSGSQKVSVFHNLENLNAHQNKSADEWVLQEYIHGPSFSIEVLGWAGKYLPLQVTDLQMDANYDCKRVLAPTDLTPSFISEFEKIARLISEQMALKGLMDVEVILHDSTLKVLEVDARLPSQTPTAVLWSTGLNIIEMLADLFLTKGDISTKKMNPPKGVVYEHIKVSPKVLEVAGEHIMSAKTALHVQQNFFGANEAITNFASDRDEWVATLIISDETRESAWDKRNNVIADIRQHFKLEAYQDSDSIIDLKETSDDPADN